MWSVLVQVADVRERKYNAAGLKDYMFRISDTEVSHVYHCCMELSCGGFYVGWLRRPLTCVPAPLPRHRL